MKKITLALLTSLCAYSNFAEATSTQINLDGSAVSAVMQERNRSLAAYQNQVNAIIAGKVREVRVEQEKAAMEKAGNPIPLPTGMCRVIVTIQPDGTIKRAQLAGCASDELGQAELEAIRRSSPLPPPGVMANVIVQTQAPVATPGVNGN